MAARVVRVNDHVTYYATGRKPRPATVVALGSTNGGIILRVGRHAETYGDATTGILRGTTVGKFQTRE